MSKYGKQRNFSICTIAKIAIIMSLKHHLLKRSQDVKLSNVKNVPMCGMFVQVINSVLVANALLHAKNISTPSTSVYPLYHFHSRMRLITNWMK